MTITIPKQSTPGEELSLHSLLAVSFKALLSRTDDVEVSPEGVDVIENVAIALDKLAQLSKRFFALVPELARARGSLGDNASSELTIPRPKKDELEVKELLQHLHRSIDDMLVGIAGAENEDTIRLIVRGLGTDLANLLVPLAAALRDTGQNSSANDAA